MIGVPGPGPFEYMFQDRPQGGAWTTVQSWGPNDNLLVDQRVIPRGRTR